MKIGLLGTGYIGKTLALKLPAAGHDLKIANSGGPDTIDAELLANGARAVTAAEAMTDIEVAIVSIPLKALPNIRHLMDALPEGVVVIDTSNYFPGRDGHITEIDDGQVEWSGSARSWDAQSSRRGTRSGGTVLRTRARPRGIPIGLQSRLRAIGRNTGTLRSGSSTTPASTAMTPACSRNLGVYSQARRFTPPI
jgi:hypothetical protein